ncbi:MAG TPA: SNF2-related protein [Actinomycetaceae bacterium]|nr:SNF2-related protein [Actinomycetaceae bacterium]
MGPSPGAPARELLDRATALADDAAAILTEVVGLREQVVAMVERAREDQVRGELAEIDVLRLRETTERNLRLQAVADAGVDTVLALLETGADRLEEIPGVGPHTARTAVAAAERLAETLREGVRLRIEPGDPGPLGLQLVTTLHRLGSLEPLVAPHARDLRDYASSVAVLAPVAEPARSRIGFALRWPSTKNRAREALTSLAGWEPWLAETGLPATVATLRAAAQQPEPGPLALWEDFERRAADYYAQLEALVPGLTGDLTGHGALPVELVERIRGLALDQSRLRATLRGYQAFGARFVLNQGRALIGDEMGLGKTVQAIAVMAHLAAGGARHFLVVCPASVLVNWTREVPRHADLVAHRLHGPGREEAHRAWLREGGVAVTTFEGLRHVPLPDDLAHLPALLVVDEAHFVKNPQARRTRVVARWAAETTRVLFLTGTPLLNSVEELTGLTELLQPELLASLPPHLALLDPVDFRRHIAPVYLRRNLEDVLMELPPRLTVAEWEEFTPAGEEAYRAAVATGNLMAMRRAELLVPDPRDSAKLTRLLEIVEEARDGGQRVVVFSFFLDVLARVHEELAAQPGIVPHGPITGSVPPSRRQDMVDAFSDSPAGAVLLAQVRAGGVGLNVQAASIVVLTEPQLVPAVEEQAVGRVHRMGQVRPVQVHRLLVEDSVDERIEELLAAKRATFDAYARESGLADQAAAAVDVSEAELARQVVAAERARLGYGPVWEELMDEAREGDQPAT